jgi:HK97 family phage major capsid protein
VRSTTEINRDREAAKTKRDSILEESRAITTRLQGESRTADDGEQERLGRLRRGAEKAEAEMASLREEWGASLVEHARTHPESLVEYEGPNPAAFVARTATPERDAAHRAIDRAERDHELPADAAARAERLLGTGTPREQSIAARWARTAGDPAYSRAFMHLLADPTRGHLLWTPQEADAYRAVEETRAYMSLTDNVGGYMVPLHLDPAIILSNAGTTNTMRRVATVKQTSSEAWQGVTSAGVAAEWLAENTQAAEATPTLAAVPIPVYKGDAFVPYSFEVGMDALNFGEELQLALVDAADRLQATAFTVGTGSDQPTGVVQAKIATDTNTAGEAIVATDLLAVQAALPARFQPRASWMSHIGVRNIIDALETTNGNKRFPELANGQLLGKPWIENSDMDDGSSILASETASNYVLLYGDFSQYFIVDRIGATLEIIPNLMGANYRPTGSRGALLWFRTGGNVSTIAAFKLLDVHTTA